MTATAAVRLTKAVEELLLGGHPWVWRDAIMPAAFPVGAVCDVLDRRGRFVARGLFDDESPIAVRLYTRDQNEPIDSRLVESRIRSAATLRKRIDVLGATNACRLLHGEADDLPGIVVDLYADTAVLRVDGRAAESLVPLVIAGLPQICLEELGVTVARIYQRDSRRSASGGANGRALFGDLPPRKIEMYEDAARFSVDVIAGQKTGFFLDQRENRRRVAALSRGADVLNCFSYTGGFSVVAALGGARRTTSVDLAKPAIEAAREAFRLSGLVAEAHRFMAEDCFAMLGQMRGQRDQYDVVVLDPPSFAPSEKAKKAAVSAYVDLNALGLSVVKPGGILATASCSSHVSPELWLEIVKEAGLKAQRRIRVVEICGAAGDHPVSPAFLEGRYLKMAVVFVE